MKCCRKKCQEPAAWLIGTANAPYCEKHAAEYPTKAGKSHIQRKRYNAAQHQEPKEKT